MSKYRIGQLVDLALSADHATQIDQHRKAAAGAHFSPIGNDHTAGQVVSMIVTGLGSDGTTVSGSIFFDGPGIFWVDGVSEGAEAGQFATVETTDASDPANPDAVKTVIADALGTPEVQKLIGAAVSNTMAAQADDLSAQVTALVTSQVSAAVATLNQQIADLSAQVAAAAQAGKQTS